MSMESTSGHGGGNGGAGYATISPASYSSTWPYYAPPPPSPYLAGIVAALDNLMQEPGASDLTIAEDMNVAETLLLASVHPDIASAYRGVLNRRGA